MQVFRDISLAHEPSSDIKEVRIADLSSEAKKNFISKFSDAKLKWLTLPITKPPARKRRYNNRYKRRRGPCSRGLVKPGAMVITTGSFHEVEPEVVRQADIIAVDHIGQSLHRGN